MKVNLQIGGLYGSRFEWASVSLWHTRTISIKKLCDEFNLPYTPLTKAIFNVSCIPCMEKEETLKIGKWFIGKEGKSLSVPSLTGVLDINRFIIIGETRYSWVSNFVEEGQIFHEAIEDGMDGVVLSEPEEIYQTRVIGYKPDPDGIFEPGLNVYSQPFIQPNEIESFMCGGCDEWFKNVSNVPIGHCYLHSVSVRTTKIYSELPPTGEQPWCNY